MHYVPLALEGKIRSRIAVQIQSEGLPHVTKLRTSERFSPWMVPTRLEIIRISMQ